MKKIFLIIAITAMLTGCGTVMTAASAYGRYQQSVTTPMLQQVPSTGIPTGAPSYGTGLKETLKGFLKPDLNPTKKK